MVALVPFFTCFALVLALPLAASADAAGSVPATKAGNGRLRVHYRAAKDPAHKDFPEVLRRSGEFEAIAQDINTSFLLPADLDVAFEECGEANASYDPEERSISMCYELIAQYVSVFTEPTDPRDVVEDEIVYSALFTFYHELGHALVDQLKLPIVGPEEDVVDEFAAVLLLRANDSDAVVAGMDQFDVDAEEDEEALDDVAYWDEHGLSAQRFYNLACFVYGSNPEKFEDVVSDLEEFEERADRCPDEYRQKVRSWDILLAPHRRPKAAAGTPQPESAGS